MDIEWSRVVRRGGVVGREPVLATMDAVALFI
jgi:hypothetical protein